MTDSIPYGPTEEDKLCRMFNARLVDVIDVNQVSCKVYAVCADNDMGIEAPSEAVLPETFGYYEKYRAMKKAYALSRNKVVLSLRLSRKYIARQKRKDTTISVEKRGGQFNRGKSRKHRDDSNERDGTVDSGSGRVV